MLRGSVLSISTPPLPRPIEQKRRNDATTRNCRLAAIKAFMRYVEFRAPSRWNRSDRSTLFRQSAMIRGLVRHLTIGEVRAILDAPDRRRASAYGTPRLSPAGFASPNWWGFRWGRFLCTEHQASVSLARAVRSGPFRFGKRPPPISFAVPCVFQRSSSTPKMLFRGWLFVAAPAKWKRR